MGVSDEALGVIPGRTAPSADLGGSELTLFESCEKMKSHTDINSF